MAITRSQTRNKKKETKKESILYRGRLIVKVPGSRFMYKSTGNCSNLGGTWFPCIGICELNPVTMTRIGWIMKPVCTVNVPWCVRFHCFNNKILDRFDTMENMVISYKLGGGFWETKESESIVECLKGIKIYRNDHSDILEYIVSSEKNVTEMELQEAMQWTLDRENM